jgi:lycopene cyclase domain-containing protein
LKSKYLYLSVNLVSIALPFIFSFYPKANFSKKWRYVLPAIAISGLFFIIWDAIFTELGVWGFNPKYVTGVYLIGLPIEEILFFFCIPYACIFTYFALNHLIEKDHLFPHQELITSILIFLLLIFGGYFMSNLYTGVTFMMTGLFLALIMLKLRTRFMGRFYFAFIVILLPFLIVNGILTGSFIDEPVVWYNNEENLGIRLGTIPVEDVVYGMLMVLIPITIAEKWEEYDYYKK